MAVLAVRRPRAVGVDEATRKLLADGLRADRLPGASALPHRRRLLGDGVLRGPPLPADVNLLFGLAVLDSAAHLHPGRLRSLPVPRSSGLRGRGIMRRRPVRWAPLAERDPPAPAVPEAKRDRGRRRADARAG